MIEVQPSISAKMRPVHERGSVGAQSQGANEPHHGDSERPGRHNWRQGLAPHYFEASPEFWLNLQKTMSYAGREINRGE